MKQECIQAVANALGRQPTQAENQKIEQRIKDAQATLWKTERSNMLGLTKPEQFQKAGELAAKQIKAEAAKRQQRAALAIIAHDRWKAELDSRSGNMLDNITDKLAWNVGGDANTTNIYSQAAAIRELAMAEISDELHAFGPSLLGFDQGNARMASVFRELRGQDSGDAAAKAFAGKLSTIFEKLREQFNSLGGKIGDLGANWGHPQAHSAYLVFKMGKDSWIDFTMPKLDRSQYLNEDGSQYGDAQMREFLDAAWKSIAYDGRLNGEIGGNKGHGSRANRHSQSRQLHFVDADNYLEYHNKVGEKSLFATIMGHIDGMAHDIAMVQELGPNPNAMFNWFADYAARQDAEKGMAPDAISNKTFTAKRLFDEVAGVRRPTGNESLARGFEAFRSLLGVKLGSAGISTISDFNTLALAGKFNGIPQSKVLVEALRAMGDKESRRMANRMGLGLQTIQGSIHRYGQEQLLNGVSAKIGGATIRLSGMPFLTEAYRQGFGVSMMDAIAHVVESHATLADVHETDARMLFAHGIDEADFALWKQATPEVWRDGKNKLLTPQAIQRIPGVDQAILDRSAQKLMALILDEQNVAVTEPGPRERAMMYGNYERGTWGGELYRSFWQFKSFGITMPLLQFKRMTTLNSNAAKAVYAAQFAAVGIALGALITQLKEIDKGNDPLKMKEGSFAFEAILNSGGLGFYGDFVKAQSGKHGNSFIGALAGPALGTFEQALNLTQGNIIEMIQGKDTHAAAEALSMANGFNPLGTLWFTKAAWNHMVFQNLQEMLSPGYLRRIKQRARREFGQQEYWRTGWWSTPERLPDLTRAVD